jgi:cold shock CspA family protein
MSYGKVKFWNRDRGFGFLTDSENRDHRDIFCHATQVPGGELREGQEVEYETRISPKTGKMEAVNVTVVM